MTATKTLGPASEAFLATLTPQTAASYAKALGPLGKKFGKRTPLDQLDAGQVSDWFEDKWGQVSSSTWNARRAALRSAVAWWQHKRWLPEDSDPAARISGKRARAQLAIEPLTEAEVRQILAACPPGGLAGIRDRALIALMFRTGLRVGEALALKCSDLDLASGTLNVRSGKGGKQRVQGLDDGTGAIVQRWLDKRKAIGLRANGSPLFCAVTEGFGGKWAKAIRPGEPLTYQAAYRMLRRRAEAAGVDYKRIHPHVLRHSYAAARVGEGASGHEISAELGHTNQSTTDEYLKHIAPPDLIRAARARKPFTEDGKEVRRDDMADLRARIDEMQAELDRIADETE